MSLTACTQPGCAGSIEDGYCDVCGMAPPAASPKSTELPATTAQPIESVRSSKGGGSSTSLSDTARSGPARSRSARSRHGTTRSSRRGHLGAGLVEVPPVPYHDPASAVMSNPEVPESARFCNCGQPVGRSLEGRPGRTEGFCRKCGTRFSFTPKLVAGEMVADQYEVLGCLAHGGYGWIYLAKDHHVSERWVVLKGLLDSGDPDAMAAAIAERQFLAKVEHPNIVRIYNFVQHPDPAGQTMVGYIVMEYVGGKSLKELRSPPDGPSRPLPLAQAIAYVLEVLPALGYLHGLGVVYCDFKPDNVIQTEEQVKLIDMGAALQIDDDVEAVYGTVGYQAPEIAHEGPSVSSDLYTVARTLAVLTFDFAGYRSTFKHSLPDPSDVPLFTRFESFCRLLRRATHAEVDRRFQAAEEMTDQLTGVLREVLAIQDGQPRPGHSTEFHAEQRVFGVEAGQATQQAPRPAAMAAALPVPSVDSADPAASFLATVIASDPAELVEALTAAPQATVEVRLRIVRARIELGELEQATAELNSLESDEPGDWRVTWYRGVAALADGRAKEAGEYFEAVYDELPGEAAPKLAIAAAAECAGNAAVAARYYEVVWRTDHGYVSAAFGLARTRLGKGDVAGAVEVLDGIPESSSHYVAAQTRAISATTAGRATADLTEQDLLAAASRLEGLQLDAQRRAWLFVDLLTTALEWVKAGRRSSTAPGAAVLGYRLAERDLRLGLERAYRSLARLADKSLERVALVDRANALRPRTLL